MSFHHCALLAVLLVAFVEAIPVSDPIDLTLSDHITLVDDKVNYRLPGNVIPSKYTLRLKTNIGPEKFDFEGETEIEINVQKDTNEIIVHAQNLTFDTQYTSICYPNGSKLPGTITGKLDPKTDFYTLTFSSIVSSGNYILKFKYTGILHDDMVGFYRSSYKNDRGEDTWLATTQFEPTYARRAFPCFDEPSYKATFKIYIDHDDQYSAVSNTPAISWTRPANSLTRFVTEFEPTPLMSTYLVAFIVSDFKYKSNDIGTFRVYARENQVEKGAFAIEVGQKALKQLEDYTGIKHAISKMDNLAIPQFRAGAMENWGAVTYREVALLVTENVTMTATKESVATVISHEFAHQWFGNLVSPLWWKFTWLNEGFANYFQYFITDKVEPTWRLMEQFVIKNLQDVAFRADYDPDQHAMDVDVNSPTEIYSIFDSISYSKAGSVIRMFSHVLTESVFQTGLKNYLNNNKFKAADSDKLIAELSAVAKGSKVDMKAALISWIRQPGYPVINVIRNYTTGSATVSQKPCLPKSNVTLDRSWFVPLNYVSEEKPDFSITKPSEWLLADKKPIELKGLKKDKWVILNAQQTGYYRVNYDVENWKLIIKYLLEEKNTKNIHPVNRAQLLDDSFNLAQMGELANHEIFFQLSTYLRNDDDYVPWYAAFRAFATLDNVLTNTSSYDLFKLYILRLTEKLEATLGYHEKPGDSHIDKLNRLNAMKLRCTMGSEKCLDATYAMLVDHVVNSTKLTGDFQSVAFCAGLKTANATIWEDAFELATTLDKSTEERTRLVIGLGCSSDEKILKDYLEKGLLIESLIDRNDVIKAVYAGSPAGINIAFSFIVDKFSILADYDGGTDKILNHLKEIAARMTTNDQLQKLEKFMADLPADREEFKKSLEPVAALAKRNIEWLTKNEPYVSSFLTAQHLVPDVTTEKPNSSSASLPTVLLIAVTTLVAAFKRS